MISVKKIGKEKEYILYNLMQKYLYEMTLYYDNPLDENGNFKYEYLPYYFVNEERQAFFIYEEECLIGFSLVNTHSFTEESIDNCIAEFTIFPQFRKHGNAMKAIDAMMKIRPGSWQLKYSTSNKIGTYFWKKVKEKYNGIEETLDGTEIVLTITSN